MSKELLTDVQPKQQSVTTRPVPTSALDHVSDEVIIELMKIAKDRYPRVWRVALNAMLVGYNIAMELQIRSRIDENHRTHK